MAIGPLPCGQVSQGDRMGKSWNDMSAADLGRAIGAGKIDPVDLTEFFLSEIEASPISGRIYARVTATRARAEAQAASDRAKRGQRRSALDGVPISWKDLFDTAGVATEAGSALLAGRVPAADCDVLRNASAAGLVCLGKTHMTELAFSGLGLNPITQTPPCVNDVDAVPGGSSSGAATSVAFGLAAAAIGSDTGGSVRIPAAWNDLVGLKTTHGLLSLRGVVPLCARFDTVGPLCKTVEDAALLLAAMQPGPAANRVADLAGVSLKGRRLAVLQTVAMEDLSDKPRAAFHSAAQRMQAAGAEVIPFDWPLMSEALSLSGVLYASEAYATWQDEIEAAPEKMFDQVLMRFRGGRDFLATEFISAWQRLDALRGLWADATAGFDAVIMPTAPINPPNAARLLKDDGYFTRKNLLALRNTRIGNLMGLSAVTLPTGVPSTGVMLCGAAGQDRRLLRLAAAAEAALA